MRLGLLDVWLYGTVHVVMGETYTIDCMLFWALNCLQLGLIHHYAFLFPTKPPQGIEDVFPMPPVISKCLSWHINFSLIQLVCSLRRGNSFFNDYSRFSSVSELNYPGHLFRPVANYQDYKFYIRY